MKCKMEVLHPANSVSSPLISRLFPSLRGQVLCQDSCPDKTRIRIEEIVAGILFFLGSGSCSPNYSPHCHACLAVQQCLQMQGIASALERAAREISHMESEAFKRDTQIERERFLSQQTHLRSSASLYLLRAHVTTLKKDSLKYCL